MTSQGVPSSAPSKGQGQFEKYFTIESANRALLLVRRIVADIRPRYIELLQRRDDFSELSREPGNADAVARCRARMEALADELNRLATELARIGCQLKDWESGLVDFPARFDDRDVLLCWRDGEDRIEHWHELEAGFRGRRSVNEMQNAE